jgi:hypothetical protein
LLLRYLKSYICNSVAELRYNKKAVKWVFFSVVFTAVFLLSFKLDSKIPHYDYFVGVWLYITVYSTFLSYRFLDIFYVLL